MFGGTPAVPDFDVYVQNMGGDSNAFTTNDYTNYYLSFPKDNLEMAFWLEADRMRGLAFTQKSLDVQKNVVIEEFKQRYLNQPYGDTWLKLRPLAYHVHPYKWATIGKDISHIENATMTDVKSFFKKYYHPSNAILCVSGNFDNSKIRRQIETYFEEIPSALKPERLNPQEPKQKEFKSKSR